MIVDEDSSEVMSKENNQDEASNIDEYRCLKHDETLKKLRELKRKRSSLEEEESDDSDLFELLKIDAVAAASHQLSITARRKGMVVKGVVSKMQCDMGYGDPSCQDEYDCLRVRS